jgi:alkyl sulfatase BDS1-like metallo-beta-lactamase superfamily hydrolase
MTTDPRAPKNATEATRAANAVLAARLPLDDDADFTRAERGLLRRARDEETRPEEALETVNPSLWRQARLNALHGLYEVTDGVYRVRGYDLANVTFIRGKRGWIVVDPLTAAETAAPALRTLREHFADERPVTAVVYTHCHVDHFAGIRGVVTDEDIAGDAVRLIGPESFLEHTVAEELELPPSLADEFFLRDY